MESASLLVRFEEELLFSNVILAFMGDIFKIYPHNPPHYFVSNAMYMVTGAILHNQHLLSENRRKEFVLHTLIERTALLGWDLQA